MHEDHSYMSLVCSHCGHTIVVPVSCGNRFCPDCGHSRRRKLRHKLSEFVRTRQLRNRDTFKLLTLSIPSSPDLKKQVDELLSSFRRLRQRAFWRRKVRGGVFVIEVSYGEAGWHAHIHAVIESAYLPYDQLLTGWKAVSTGSGAHIKAIPPRAIISYVTKYVTKTDLAPERQTQASKALAGKRLYQPFGEWHNPMNQIHTPVCTCGQCGRAQWTYGDPSVYAARVFRDRPGTVTPAHHFLDVNPVRGGPV